MGTIYAFANQKGGVGKTTTAVNIGAFLAWQGRRVLLIDLDPQGNASASLGVDRFALPASIYDVLMGSATLREILTSTAMERLTLAPSVSLLAGAEVELTAVPDREFILRNALTAASEGCNTTEDSSTERSPQHSIRDDFDHILIDCPPSLGILTVNALTSADLVVVPVQCEYLALEGLAQLMQTIALVRENLNPSLKLFGLVMTMFDPRARLGTQVIQEVRAHFPNELFETYIPRNVRVAEAPSFGEPLVKFDIHSRGAEAYEKLTNEFLMREARMANSGWQVANSVETSTIGYPPSAINPTEAQ
jgi:chromosome partitioning protein